MSGINASYYPSLDFTGVPIQRVDPVIAFDGTNLRLPGGFKLDKFTVRWEGAVRPDTAGTLYFKSDDGCRIWVDGKLVIDKWVRQAATVLKVIDFVANRSYALRIEYFQNGGGMAAFLQWAHPGAQPATVPTGWLIPGAVPVTAPSAIESTPVPAPTPAPTPTPVPSAVTVKSSQFNSTYFPIAVWLAAYEDLEKWKSRGINTVWHNEGIPGLPKTLDEYTNKLASLQLRHWRYPATLMKSPGGPDFDKSDMTLSAYALLDEPLLHGKTPADYAAQAKQFRAVRNLPLVLNLEGDKASRPISKDYIATADWIFGDWYPVNRRSATSNYPLEFVAKQTEDLLNYSRDAGGNTKPVGAIIECSFQGLKPDYPGIRRCPTVDEFRVELWLAIIYGCRLIAYFPEDPSRGCNDATPPDIAAEMTKQNSIIQSLAPVLLSAGERLPAQGALQICKRYFGGNTYTFVLNTGSVPQSYNGSAIPPFHGSMFGPNTLSF